MPLQHSFSNFVTRSGWLTAAAHMKFLLSEKPGIQVAGLMVLGVHHSTVVAKD